MTCAFDMFALVALFVLYAASALFVPPDKPRFSACRLLLTGISVHMAMDHGFLMRARMKYTICSGFSIYLL